MRIEDKRLSKEFEEFLQAKEMSPTVASYETIFSVVHRDLNPTSRSVFLKMLAIHSVVSFFTLSFCSQFGIRTLPIFDLMFSMMSLAGERYCMAFCGIFYVGVSAVTLSFLLTPEEVQVIRKTKLLQLTLLSGISLGVFLGFGATVVLWPGIIWFLGSILGGSLGIELGWFLRSKLRKNLIFGI